ncbi:hypothetical protein AB0O01_18795 [Streptomyces sp. NPDC093252]|uniref:hypothetical protein n=1 Tax=Streptomyces sp. NPDC093252 TaxID=3154980 RepID=UPI00341D7182
MTRRTRLLVSLGAVLAAGLSAGGATLAGDDHPSGDRISYVVQETDSAVSDTGAEDGDCPWQNDGTATAAPADVPEPAL